MSESKIPVFRINPRNRRNKVSIKYVGIIDSMDKLGDEIVELDRPIHHDHDVYGKHSIPIKRIGEYEIVGRIYRCNIIGDYLIKQSDYPYIYLNIGYDRSLVSGSLIQLFLIFEMDCNEKKSIVHPNQYIDREVNGCWKLQIECDETMLQNYEILTRKAFEEMIIREFSTNDRLTDEELIQIINLKVDLKMEKIRSLIKGEEFIFQTKDQARDYLVELSQSDDFYQLLVVAMKCRELTRRKESHLDDDSHYTIPMTITKMHNLEKDLMENNEFILD